jgi:signal transduction histidine kinase
VAWAGRVIAGLAFLISAIIAFGGVSGHAALVLSDAIFPFIALGAGALLIIGGSTRSGHERVSWVLFGSGVVSLGLGELTWCWYELILGVEPPYPGIPDVFYLGAYPILALALLMTPRLAANPYQAVRQVLDAIVITIGVAVLAWFAVLEPMYASSAGIGLGEFAVGAGYPVADVILIATVGAVGLDRTASLNNRALWSIVAGLLAMAAGDIVYLTQSWAGTYTSGSWVDATWLVSYGLFALGASFLPGASEVRVPRERRLPLWHVLIPAAVLFALVGGNIGRYAFDGDLQDIVFDVGLTALGLVILARVLLAMAEDRHLVGIERKQLISVVSHELRTPLTAVQGYLDLVSTEWEGLDDRARRDMVTVAMEQARLVGRIVTDLVAASRDELHATQLDKQTVDVAAAVDEAVGALGLGAVTTISVEQGSLVRADRERLAQILTNLLSNADRYGNRTIACFAHRSSGFVEIGVHDDGPGVPVTHRETIWDRFERGAHRFDSTTPGSGLGLAIVRSLVLAHGGSVGYRTSQLLGGACFWVRLPSGTPETTALDDILDGADVLRLTPAGTS